MDGGFLLRITADQTTFFFTAGGSIDPIGLSGRATGLLIVNYPALPAPPASRPDGAGIAGCSASRSASDPAVRLERARSSLSDISGIFSFHGTVKVTFNTTLSTRPSPSRQEFLNVLPSGFPSPITIPTRAPEIDGSVRLKRERRLLLPGGRHRLDHARRT